MKRYRLLLLAFPRHVREEFGREMELMFEEQLRMAEQNGGSALRLWAMAASDAIRHGLAERFSGNRPPRSRAVGFPQKRRLWLQALLQDLRHAGRLFAAQPAITASVF
jgi:hypothetical protein